MPWTNLGLIFHSKKKERLHCLNFTQHITLSTRCLGYIPNFFSTKLDIWWYQVKIFTFTTSCLSQWTWHTHHSTWTRTPTILVHLKNPPSLPSHYWNPDPCFHHIQTGLPSNSLINSPKSSSSLAKLSSSQGSPNLGTSTKSGVTRPFQHLQAFHL